MSNSAIAFGGTLKSAEEEERLVTALWHAGLPINLDGENSEFTPDEPPHEDEAEQWYRDAVEQAVTNATTLCLTTWEEDDDLFHETRDLEKLLKELGFSWRVFDNGRSKIDEAHNGTDSQCGVTLYTPDTATPYEGVGTPCDPVRNPMVFIQRPLDEADVLERARRAIAVIEAPLPPLARSYDPA